MAGDLLTIAICGVVGGLLYVAGERFNINPFPIVIAGLILLAYIALGLTELFPVFLAIAVVLVVSSVVGLAAFFIPFCIIVYIYRKVIDFFLNQ